MSYKIIIIILFVLILIYKFFNIEGFNVESIYNLQSVFNTKELHVNNLNAQNLNILPINTIVIWNTKKGNIPPGWIKCDGQNGTPNLINRYPMGHTLSGQMANKNINVNARTNTSGNHRHSIGASYGQRLTGVGLAGKSYSNALTGSSLNTTGNHTHSVTINSASAIEPDHTTVLFIMKISGPTIPSNSSKKIEDLAKAYNNGSVNFKNVNVTKNFNILPKGSIIFWKGTTTNIPNGWVLCNGQNGTPNMIGQFFKGSTSTGSIEKAKLTTSANTSTNGNHGHGVSQGGKNFLIGIGGCCQSKSNSITNLSIGASGNHAHNISINASASSNTNLLHPDYTSLIPIMKT